MSNARAAAQQTVPFAPTPDPIPDLLERVVDAASSAYNASRFAPKDASDLRDLAELWYDSRLLPDTFYPRQEDKPQRGDKEAWARIRWQGVAKAIIVMRHGAVLGLLPEIAIQQVHVVKGRPYPSAAALVGVVERSGLCADWSILIWDQTRVRIRAQRKGRQPQELEVNVSQFQHLVNDPKRATWKQYPMDMLWARCAASLARKVWPDVTNGMWVAEEALDFDAPPAKSDAKKPGANIEELLAAAERAASYTEPVESSATEEAVPERAPDAPPPAPKPAQERTQEDEAHEFADQIRAATTPLELTALRTRIQDRWGEVSPLRAKLLEQLKARYAEVGK